jgi:hypothetical protein
MERLRRRFVAEFANIQTSCLSPVISNNIAEIPK